MVGALNKLPVAASGILFFGDAATFSSVSAIVLGFLAGLVYSAAKTAQKKREVGSYFSLRNVTESFGLHHDRGSRTERPPIAPPSAPSLLVRVA